LISGGSCALAAKTRPSKKAVKNTGESRVREVPLNVSLVSLKIVFELIPYRRLFSNV
jgi:hypothetical protein